MLRRAQENMTRNEIVCTVALLPVVRVCLTSHLKSVDLVCVCVEACGGVVEVV